MLKNILKPKIDDITKIDANAKEIVYNQKPIVVKPGACLDVRDFGIPNESIVEVENHLLLKHPNIFVQTKTEDVFKTNMEALKKIDDLEAENAKLKEDLNSARKAYEESKKSEASVKAQNEGLTNQAESLKKQVGELKAKLKALK